MPIPCKPLPIHKCQFLANCCQFTSANSLQTATSSQVPIPCKLLPIQNSHTRACKLFQFTSAKTVQTDINWKMPNKSLQTASIHKCQYFATRRHFRSAKPKPESAKNLRTALNSSFDSSPCQWIPLGPEPKKVIQGTYRFPHIHKRQSLHTASNSQVPRKLQLIHTLQTLPDSSSGWPLVFSKIWATTSVS